MRRGRLDWYRKYRNYGYQYYYEGDLPREYFEKHIMKKYGAQGKYCPHCGQMVVKSDIPNYPYLCLRCDENFYSCEV